MSPPPVSYHGTPVKKRSNVNDPLSYIGPIPEGKARYREFAKDMAAQFIGPMPLTQFLKDFVPRAPRPFPSTTDNVFEDVLKGPNRPGDFEDRFIRAVERSKLCPTVQFFNTTDGPDTNIFYRTKIDMSGHRHPSSPESSPTLDSSNSERTSLRGSVNWTIMEIGLELKDEDEDPFQDPPPGLSSEARKDHNFEKDTKAAHSVRGQMIAYAASHQAAQFRSFCFSVLLLKGQARLVRWDRAGAIVTEKFNYTNCADNLVEFLWRFGHMDAESRGHDLTVTSALPEEIQLANQHLPGGSRGNMHKVTIHDDKDNQDHHFLVSSATDWTLAATGRCTRGWVAFDLATGERAWLKDSWRIDMAEMEKEVDIYRDLNKWKVRNVPTMLQGGDIAGQSTVTGNYVNEPWCCGEHEILKHQHCRLALDVIGRKLQEFKSSKELSSAVNDALIGHSDAYHLAEVLHRDVSGGNILIRDDGTGLLIDWDLCKRVKAPAAARRNWRTGTWRFISTAILEQRGKLHELSDDLESFFHVLLYHALRYRAASKELSSLEKELQDMFDWSRQGKDGHVYGGRGKKNFFGMTGPLLAEDLADVLPAPLAELIDTMRKIFFLVYANPNTPSPPVPERVEEAKQKLHSYEHFLALFKAHLAQDGWPSDDRASDVLRKANAGEKRKKSSAGGSRRGSSKRSKKDPDQSRSLNVGSIVSVTPTLPSLAETDPYSSSDEVN